MSKYIDKDELWERLRKHMVHHIVTNTLFNTIKAVIDGMPTIEVSEDCISRELALEVISDYVNYPTEGDKVCAVKNAPSVVVRNNRTSEDCISREWVKGICENMLDEEMFGHMLGYIEDAPSVVPSRAEGAWITAPNSYEIICSNCESEAFSEDGEYVKTNFCPNCGAKMKV